MTEGSGAGRQLARLDQILQAQAPHHFGTAKAQHQLGPGIEGGDHTPQVGGDDGDLGGGIQHTAQLPVGFAQLTLTDLQLRSALVNQGQGALALADQAVQQGAEQQAEHATE
ncbi:hypothetical protein D3C85_948840 [compost metagenome]